MAEHPFLVSYGRRHGRALTEKQQALFKTLLPQCDLSLPKETLDPHTCFTHKPKHIWFELGFGAGEHLAHQAETHPDIGFIGSEVYENGVAKLLRHIQTKQLTNIKLFREDARHLLHKLTPESLDRIFILFPDPWPKKKHHKRRFISQENLALCARLLTTKGILRIATDHADYARWIMVQLMQQSALTWQANQATDWSNIPADHITTRYEQKAAKEGRLPVFIDLIKT